MSSKKSTLRVVDDKLKDSRTLEFPGSVTNDAPNFFSMKNFVENTKIEVKSSNEEEIVFDIIGIEPPIVNAIRRILLSEIPTMAFETVNILQNTSIIPDEVLSHRLGLIPFISDAEEFQYKKDSEELNEFNSLNFTFKAEYVKSKKPSDESMEVYSSLIHWVPIGNQKKNLKTQIKMVADDILINKLRPGQSIEIEMTAIKGIGKTHAKWSPVCTAFYRLLPEINIKSKITDQQAEELVKLCPKKVFDIEDLGSKSKAVVARPRDCSTCRECIKHPEFKDKIELGKVKDHYEFHIESVGIYTPSVLFQRALDILKEKCDTWKCIVDEKFKDKDQ